MGSSEAGCEGLGGWLDGARSIERSYLILFQIKTASQTVFARTLSEVVLAAYTFICDSELI